MAPADVVLLLAAGLAAGVVNGMAGGGSLVSYPALLTVGYTPLVSSVTNTVGLVTGYLGGAAGFRDQLHDQRQRVRQLAPVGIAGGIAGAVLLLTTPESVFDWVVPFLIIGACLLFAVQPWVSKRVAARRQLSGIGSQLTRPTYVATFGASVYGGYFGAGLGVILLAVLGTALPDPLPKVNSLRGVLSLVVNLIAVVVFSIWAEVAWEAVAVMAVACLIGGYVGARTSLRLPAPVLRGVVLLFGVVAAARLLVA